MTSFITSLEHKYRLQPPLACHGRRKRRRGGEQGGCVGRNQSSFSLLISALTSLFAAIWRGCRGPAAAAGTHQQAERVARFESRNPGGKWPFFAAQCCILAPWRWPPARGADVGFARPLDKTTSLRSSGVQNTPVATNPLIVD